MNNISWSDVDDKACDKFYAQMEHIENSFISVCERYNMSRLLYSSSDNETLLVYCNKKNGDVASLLINYVMPAVDSNLSPYTNVCVKTNLPLSKFSACSPVKLNNIMRKSYKKIREKLEKDVDSE